MLGEEDLANYGIAGCDSRNAEMIFLADPGVLIFPNFFQARGDPIKGAARVIRAAKPRQFAATRRRRARCQAEWTPGLASGVAGESLRA